MDAETLKLYIALQPEIREAMGPIIAGDWLINPYTGKPTCVTSNGQFGLDSCIRLPLPINPLNPSRGLWGMVDWQLFHSLIGIDGRLLIMSRDQKFDSDWQTPELALLKALCHQHGKEMEG